MIYCERLSGGCLVKNQMFFLIKKNLGSNELCDVEAAWNFQNQGENIGESHIPLENGEYYSKRESDDQNIFKQIYGIQVFSWK